MKTWIKSLFAVNIIINSLIFVKGQDKMHLTADSLFELSLDELMNVTVVSASRSYEPLSEVPVPVTIITSDMIKSSGSIDLRDILVMYVPGLTKVEDTDESNIAMHGVFGSNQQKILFMLNGHRLNTRTVLSAFPDFINSVDKIERIEVLRGPASSLYGNAALTSVVNIITKKGGEVNGLNTAIRLGNFGQKNLSVLYGNQPNPDDNLLIWANLYQSTGEKIFVPKEKDYSPNPKDGYSYIGRVYSPIARDWGMNYQSKKIEIMGNYRKSARGAPFTTTGRTGEVYQISDYRKFEGFEPGTGHECIHIDIKYQEKISEMIHIQINPYFDQNRVLSNHVIDPDSLKISINNYDDYAFGGIASIIKNYNSFGSGNIVAGLQIEEMKVYNSYWISGSLGEFSKFSDSHKNQLVPEGSETSISAFLQIKHFINEKLLANFGFRNDYKTRIKEDNVYAISPRLALVWFPSEGFNLKTSYSKSFVDASYFYRYNNTIDFKGSASLKPEELTAFQITPGFWYIRGIFGHTVNFFYNDYRNIIFRNSLATGNQPRYKNAGFLKSAGWENELWFNNLYVNIKANFTYQFCIDAQEYKTTGNKINNIPAYSGNLILDSQPFQNTIDGFYLSFSTNFIGKQVSPINSIRGQEVINISDNNLNPVVLFNGGLRYDNKGYYSIFMQVSNLLNTKYYLGGTTLFPYQQKGRWMLFGLSYTLKTR